jgi:hypothetical protein
MLKSLASKTKGRANGVTPSMRDKSAYMLSKTHYTATISNTIRASRKRLSALKAEYASLEVQRTALMEQIQILENEKAAWVKTNRNLQQDRKKCPHNRLRIGFGRGMKIIMIMIVLRSDSVSRLSRVDSLH